MKPSKYDAKTSNNKVQEPWRALLWEG